jgi:peroxiredoxin
MFCREQAARLERRRTEIEGRGGRIIAIGNGTALMARDFVEQFHIGFAVYTDPERKSYAVAKWRRGTKPTLRRMAAMAKHAARALAGGHLQGLVKGDRDQLGGLMVIGPDGEVLLEHRDEIAGDHADLDAVVAALPGKE